MPAQPSARTTNNSEDPEDINRLAHDARNIVSALTLFSELLSTPGVLKNKHSHRAQELQVIVNCATQIIDRMARAKGPEPPPEAVTKNQALPRTSPISSGASPAFPVTDTGAELLRLQPLLVAIAGPTVRLSIAAMPCPGRTALAVEDLSRILVNLVRNAVDAMPSRGSIRITAQYGDGVSFLDHIHAESEAPRSVLLTVADDGPGIPEPVRERIFDPGFTTREPWKSWPSRPGRGLGLSIVRSLVEEAGGTVRAAANLVRGARFEIAVPLLEPIASDTYSTSLNSAFSTEERAKGCLECH